MTFGNARDILSVRNAVERLSDSSDRTSVSNKLATLADISDDVGLSMCKPQVKRKQIFENIEYRRGEPGFTLRSANASVGHILFLHWSLVRSVSGMMEIWGKSVSMLLSRMNEAEKIIKEIHAEAALKLRSFATDDI